MKNKITLLASLLASASLATAGGVQVGSSVEYPAQITVQAPEVDEADAELEAEIETALESEKSKSTTAEKPCCAAAVKKARTDAEAHSDTPVSVNEDDNDNIVTVGKGQNIMIESKAHKKPKVDTGYGRKDRKVDNDDAEVSVEADSEASL